ncbi:hypothetical protein [Phycicoccus sp. Soil748]|uniref:hypothetical protein n=1 Tax=Phycicoccus sp. Soil748 TaxID=1736397 RepID=UPI000703B1C5|nr:hypothetical protein [Phycicoccus sp. Soil748]KRE56458.1 hypothetical protein ASG70_04910 [Phycicoccus sp. Soil748]
MPSKSIVTAACGIAAATGIVIAAASLANASATNAPAASAGYALGYGQQGTAPQGGPQGDRGPGGNHTPVTGSELTKVTAAVKAKDSAVTVTSARKDEDGSYDVFGTKAGAPVRVEVSKDLKTVTVETGGPGGGRGHGGMGGGMGGSADTPVTGAELTKVTAAVKAKDSAVTVSSVRKDPDGSYDVLGTKAGAPVMLEVSKDLKTITTRTGGPGGHGPDGDRPGLPGTQSGTQSGTGANTPSGTATGTAYRTV